MTVWVLFWEVQYEGQQILGVFATREEAEAAMVSRSNGDHSDEYIREMEVGRLYPFGEICSE